MKLTSLQAVDNTDLDVTSTHWRSRRLLVAGENLQYSLHDTVVYAGATFSMHYKHHIESAYIIDGHGELTNDDTGERHVLSPGTLYLLDNHDRHTLHAITQLHAVCVFTPPVSGTEVHDEDGAYPPAAKHV